MNYSVTLDTLNEMILLCILSTNILPVVDRKESTHLHSLHILLHCKLIFKWKNMLMLLICLNTIARNDEVKTHFLKWLQIH